MINQMLDISSVAHVFKYIVVGILFPNNYIGALALGIAWELFEECITKKEFSRDLLVKHFNSYKDLWDESKRNKLLDLVFNMIGYYLGNRIRGMSPL